jgi:hypothetical protein
VMQLSKNGASASPAQADPEQITAARLTRRAARLPGQSASLAGLQRSRPTPSE